jgi:Ankyrin repeats (3 copies)
MVAILFGAKYAIGCIYQSLIATKDCFMMLAKPSAITRVHAWFSAISTHDTALLNDLLAHGMPMDTLHPLRHHTALMEATRLGRAATVRWLIEQGAAPAFLCGTPASTALHYAIRRRQWEIAAILADTMESCAIIDTYGATPLHTLCAESYLHEPSIDMLALAGVFMLKNCPLDALDHEGTTALHHCVINEQAVLAQALLGAGANPNALIPDSHVSPLVIAALEKNMPMAKLLLHHGADPHVRTLEGVTACTIYPALAELVAHETTRTHHMPPQLTQAMAAN